MKKSISVLAAAMLLSCTFVSCGSKDDDEKESIIGVWSAGEDFAKELSEEWEAPAENITIEFTSDNKMLLNADMDFSEMVTVGEDTVVWNGNSVPFTYDGSVLTIAGKIEFERIGEADESSVYGKYNSSDFAEYMGLTDDEGSAVFNFKSADSTVLTFIRNGTYEYDEKEGTLSTSLDDEGDEPTKVEIDGDTLTMTDSDGEKGTFTRVK